MFQPTASDIAQWIANDEWLYLHHKQMTKADIVGYIQLRFHGKLNEPPHDYVYKDGVISRPR